LPLAGFARAVGITAEQAIGQIGEFFTAAFGIFNRYGQALRVVAVLGAVSAYIFLCIKKLGINGICIWTMRHKKNNRPKIYGPLFLSIFFLNKL
jgi:hypothetical protein